MSALGNSNVIVQYTRDDVKVVVYSKKLMKKQTQWPDQSEWAFDAGSLLVKIDLVSRGIKGSCW